VADENKFRIDETPAVVELNCIHENGSAKFLRHGIAPAEMPLRRLAVGVVSQLIHRTEFTIHTNKQQPRTWPNTN
jgi:hypothetical protein